MGVANDNTDELTRRKKGGAWLKAKREATGRSQKELADQLGLEYYTFIAQLENGQAGVPDALVEEYAIALGTSHDEFLAHHMYFYYRPEVWRNSDFVKKYVPELNQK